MLSIREIPSQCGSSRLEFPARTQLYNNVDSTLIQRLEVESILNRRCFNVMCPLSLISVGAQHFLQDYICNLRWLRSACASAQSDKSMPDTLWRAKDPKQLQVESKDWSACADVRAHPSLWSACMQYCRKCCVPSHMIQDRFSLVAQCLRT